MSAKRIFRLSHATARRLAHEAIDTAPDGFMVEVSEPAKKRIQEEKYHAMIGDIARDCEFMGKKWDRETWKRLLLDAYVRVARNIAYAEGRPDPFPDQSHVIPALDGHGFVQLGVQSRSFKVKQAADFIEYLYAYGSEQGVRWSEPMMYREAA